MQAGQAKCDYSNRFVEKKGRKEKNKQPHLNFPEDLPAVSGEYLGTICRVTEAGHSRIAAFVHELP